MASITTRAGKGSPLTNAEVDANFTNLNTELATKVTSGGAAAAAPVQSVAGKTGAVALSTSDVSEGTNLYHTVARVRAAISASGSASYDPATGVFSVSVPVSSVAGKTGAVTLSNADVGLGNVENKSSATIRSELTLANVTAALGFTPYNSTNPLGYITGITSSMVTNALGYTPYNSTNPSGYITNTGNARVGIENNGTLVGTRRNINFIPGTGINLSITDDSANEEVDVTINSTVSVPVTSVFGRTGAVTLQSYDVTSALGYTPYNSSNPNGYITSGGEVNRSYRSIIEDTRSGQRSPNAYDDYRASYEFTNQIVSDWHTAFTMQGWSDGYAAWQLIGPASTTAHENWYLRSGVNTSWNSLRTILHSGNYTSYSPSLTGSGASGTWGISITGNAATITNQSNSATITASTGVDGNNIVRRDGNGYIYASHINFNTSESENPSISSFITSNGDGWSRKSSLAHVKNQIRGVADGTWGINITGNANYATSAGYADSAGTATSAFGVGSNGNDWSGFGQSSSAGGATAVGGHYPFAFNYHTGLAFSAHSYYGGIRFYNQNYPTAPMTSVPVLQVVDGTVRMNGNQVLNSGNYNSYSPTLTGGGASGTWGINITGNAATASNGGVTSVNGMTGAVTVSPTTTQVLNATASASVGAVGTYAQLHRPAVSGNVPGGAVAAGATLAGSSLRYSGSIPRGTTGGTVGMSQADGGAPAGTWRCMGQADALWYNDGYAGTTYYATTLWLRIS